MQAVRWCVGSGLVGGMAGGAAVAWFMRRSHSVDDYHRKLHSRLPQRVVLIRHGESEANADETLWRIKADNLIELTEKGKAQAREAGERLTSLVHQGSVIDLHISPFARTLETARQIRQAFDDKVRITHVDPRIREQELGNTQSSDMKCLRAEQQSIGRFFYRFPTGESGADVFDRVSAWWDAAITQRAMGPSPPDTVIVVTHGLAMRFVLMQVFGWSPDTFHTVWNAGNCDIYVLEKVAVPTNDYLMKPYVLNKAWDCPRSSKTVTVSIDGAAPTECLIEDYLSLSPPRTRNKTAARLIEQQRGLPQGSVEVLDFRPLSSKM